MYRKSRTNFKINFENKFIDLVDLLSLNTNRSANEKVQFLTDVAKKLSSLKILVLKRKNDLVWELHNTHTQIEIDSKLINLCRLNKHITYTNKLQKKNTEHTKLIIIKKKSKDNTQIITERKIKFFNLDNTYKRIMHEQTKKPNEPRHDKQSTKGCRPYTDEQRATAQKKRTEMKAKIDAENEKRRLLGKEPLKNEELKNFKKRAAQGDNIASDLEQPATKKTNSTFFSKKPDLVSPVSGDDLNRAIEKIAKISDKKSFPDMLNRSANKNVQIVSSFKINKTTEGDSDTTSESETEVETPEVIEMNSGNVIFESKEYSYKEQIERNKIRNTILEKGILDPIIDKQKIEILISQERQKTTFLSDTLMSLKTILQSFPPPTVMV